MGTKIVVSTSYRVYTVSPSTHLPTLIATKLEDSEEVQRLLTSEVELVEVPDRNVGTEPWTILCHESSSNVQRAEFEALKTQVSSLSSQVSSLTSRVTRLEGSLVVVGSPYLQTVAAECLLHAAGANKEAFESYRFKKMASKGNVGLLKFTEAVKEHIGMEITADSYAAAADKMIDRRNLQACHYESWASLDTAVEEARKLLVLLPALRGKHKAEAMVLDLYEQLKEAFGVHPE